MDLEATAQLLGNLGEFFGAVAVVVTLVYLAVQVKQGALQTRNNTIQALMSMEANGRFMMLNSDVSSFVVRVRKGDPLSEEEQAKLSSFMHGVFQHYEASYHAYLMGTVPKEIIEAIDERIKTWFVLPDWEEKWRFFRTLQTQSFRKHVESLMELES